MRPPRDPDIEAKVIFLAPSEGGRTSSAFSGYRPNHLVLPDYLTSGHHEYKDTEEVPAGGSAIAEIWFLAPEHYPHCMYVGREIPVQEGARLVAHATVLRVINPNLQK
jgi:translation elongation factor EF-Tu-like GTPase